MHVHVDRLVEELRRQAQVAGAQPRLFAHLAHGGGQERAVTLLTVPAWAKEQPCHPMPDVKHPAVAVDDYGAAGRVSGQRGTVGRLLGAVEYSQQPCQGISFLGMSAEIGLDGRGYASGTAARDHVGTWGTGCRD